MIIGLIILGIIFFLISITRPSTKKVNSFIFDKTVKTNYRFLRIKEFSVYDSFLQFEHNNKWYFVPNDLLRNYELIEQNIFSEHLSSFGGYYTKYNVIHTFSSFEDDLKRFTDNYPYIYLYFQNIQEKNKKYKDKQEIEDKKFSEENIKLL